MSAPSPLEANQQQPPTRFRWVVFGLGCGTSWVLYLHRYTFALVKKELKDEWGLTNQDLGLLDSAFSIAYSAFQIPAGLLADFYGAHLFLGAIILIWSFAIAMHAWAPGLTSMAYARGIFGAGQAGAFAALSRLTRTWFPFSSRTSAQGWIGVSFGRIGGLSSNVLFAAVMLGLLAMDWRTALYILAAVGVVHGIVFLIFFRNSPRDSPWVNSAEADLIEVVPEGEVSAASAQKMTIRQMFSRMKPRAIVNLIVLTITSTFSTIADNIYSAWIPLFLAEVHGLNFKEMGIYSALPLLGGALGGGFSGMLNDRLIRLTGNRRWTRSLIGFGGKAIAAVILVFALMTSYDNPYRFCGYLFFVKLFADAGLSTRWGTITDISGNASATVFAFNNSLAALFAMGAPILYGVVSHKFGWQPVFMIAIGAYVLCAISWLFVNCTLELFPEEESA
jgi:sugar phosphate permease